MKTVFTTPYKDCLLAELREKASNNLNNIMNQTTISLSIQSSECPSPDIIHLSC